MLDAETEAPTVWLPDVNIWLIGKDPDSGERLKAEGEEGNRGWDGWMASLLQWTWTWANLGDGKGQGGLACCSPWGHKESDMTWWLNNNSLNLDSYVPELGWATENIWLSLCLKSSQAYYHAEDLHMRRLYAKCPKYKKYTLGILENKWENGNGGLWVLGKTS